MSHEKTSTKSNGSKRDGLREWMGTITNESSIHGLMWYNRIKNRSLKFVFVILTFLLLILVPTLITMEAIKWTHTKQVTINEERKSETFMTYPPLVLCHPKFFNATKMADFGVSNEMANLVASMFIPSLNMDILKMYGRQQDVQALQAKLDTLLAQIQMSLPQLMRAIAIPCKEFIPYCSLKGIPYHDCCGEFFDTTPIFNHAGVCYVTKTEVVEWIPSQFSNFQIWLMDRTRNHYPKFRAWLLGAAALSRTGVNYGIGNTKDDHPVAIMEKKYYTSKFGNFENIAFDVKREDRSNLGTQHCYDNSSPGSWWPKGLNYTKMNCLSFYQYKPQLICTMNGYYNNPDHMNNLTGDGPPDCSPMMILTMDHMNLTTPERVCLPKCEEIKHNLKITTGPIDTVTVQEELSSRIGGSIDMIALSFHFGSFDISNYVLKQETFTQFLSSVGGWLGLALGASIISFIELGYFFALLLKTLICYYPKQK